MLEQQRLALDALPTTTIDDMQYCPVDPLQLLDISQQLLVLQATQTQPFLQLVEDYTASLQSNRVLQVRCAQLDKEAAELRDEVVSLIQRLEVADEAKAKEWKAQAESSRRELASTTRELESTHKEVELLRAKLTELSDTHRATEENLQSVTEQLEQVQGEASLLRDALSQTQSLLEHETASRIAAASEVQAALDTRESALVESERLRAENTELSRRLVDLKSREAERMNEINKIHEEVLAQAEAAKREAEAEREAAQLIRNKAGAMAAATLQAAASAIGLAPTPHAQAVAQPAQQPTQQQPADSSRQGSGSGSGGGWLASAAQVKAVAQGFAAPAVLGRVFGRTNSQTTSQSPLQQVLQPPSTNPAVTTRTSVGSSSGAGRSSSQGETDPLGVGGGMESAASGVQGWDVVSLPASSPPGANTAPATPDAPALGATLLPGDTSGGAGQAGLAPLGLKELMEMSQPGGKGVGALGDGAEVERRLPSAPYRGGHAHRGGCSGLAMQHAGHLMVSCGMDSRVCVWDLTVMRSGAGAHLTLAGMTAGVNDVSWVADGTLVLAAGSDKSLRLWNANTGIARHTLTGHSAAVVCCAASPLDSRCAASVGEDRTMRLWDLGKGFCVHSVSCGKMPNALAMSGDGNTIATGHVDGSVCLWDVRQCWQQGKSQPLAEVKVTTSLVTCLSSTRSDSLLLASSKDGAVVLWDFRMQEARRTLRAPRFTPGTHGSSGRGRCHVAMSQDGRWVAAGGSDGGVYVWDLVPPTAGTSPAKGVGHTHGHTSSHTLTVLHHHKDAVVATAWSPDASALVTADKAGVVAFWSLSGHSEQSM